jgi:hypothetical protein
VRLTSYRNVLWIIALLAVLCLAATAQVRSGAAPAPSATIDIASPQAGTQSPAGNQPTGPASQATSSNSVQTEGRVDKASIIPDSGSLLPVAAVVGFSFLLGGIVCGTIKKRP